MATTYYCQNSSSNINDAANWDTNPAGGGTDLTWPPASDDILVANGKTSILVNVSVTCGKLTTAANGGTAGGGFTYTSASAVTITADIVAGSTPCLVCSHTATGANKLTIVAASATGITGGSSNSAYGCNNTSSGAIDITANCNGGSTTSAHGLRIGGTGAINVTGNLTGGAAFAYGSIVAANATVNITGNASGGTDTPSQGLSVDTGTVTITGSLYNNAKSTSVYGKVFYNPSAASNIIQFFYDGTAGHTYNYAKEPAATDIKSGVVVGTVTGTYSGGGGGALIGPGALIT